MTIQISVLIWTMICFVLLYLILDRLLFKPVLAVIDARNKKIEDVKAAEKEAELNAQRLKAEAQEKQAAIIEQQQAAIKAEAEQIRSEGKVLLEEARQSRIATVAKFREDAEAGYSGGLQQVSDCVDSAAGSFAGRILKHS